MTISEFGKALLQRMQQAAREKNSPVQPVVIDRENLIRAVTLRVMERHPRTLKKLAE